MRPVRRHHDERADPGDNHQEEAQDPKETESSEANNPTGRHRPGTTLEPGIRPKSGESQEGDDEDGGRTGRKKGKRYREVQPPTDSVGDQRESNQGVTSMSTM